MSAALAAEDVQAFRNKGAVCLRQVVDLSWLDVLAEGLEKNLNDPSPYGCRYTAPGSPGAFVDDYCNWQRFSEYRSFVFDSGLGEVVAELLGSSVVRFFHEHVLVKEPGTREISPWHQDQPYYCVTQRRKAAKAQRKKMRGIAFVAMIRPPQSDRKRISGQR